MTQDGFQGGEALIPRRPALWPASMRPTEPSKTRGERPGLADPGYSRARGRPSIILLEFVLGLGRNFRGILTCFVIFPSTRRPAAAWGGGAIGIFVSDGTHWRI